MNVLKDCVLQTMVYCYELGDDLTNPYLMRMTCESAQTYNELITYLRTSKRITYIDEYVLRIGNSMFSLDSIRELYSYKQRNVPIYFV